jgi:predicted Zn-dependent peptidase
MGIRQFYNERMTRPAEALPGAPLRTEVLDNGLKVLILEEHTAPLGVGVVLVQGRITR